MTSKLYYQIKKIRILLVCSLLSVGLSEFQIRHAQAQWKPIVAPKKELSPVVWENKTEPEKHYKSQEDWELVPKDEDQNQPSAKIIWEVLESNEMKLVPPLKTKSNPIFTVPANFEEAEALLDNIPQSSDFKPLLNLSHAVPTASILNKEEWRLTSTLSPLSNMKRHRKSKLCNSTRLWLK